MVNYKLSISMSILENLGLNLYSSIPAVIAEAIANSYDADAERVDIDIDPKTKTITITDDGHGMTEKECNDRYLLVGYHRRDVGEIETPKHHRPVMGRKGIGKLSLFSIAKNIEIHTIKLDKDEKKIVEKNGFIMDRDTIIDDIKKDGVKESNGCDLTPVDPKNIEIHTIKLDKDEKKIVEKNGFIMDRDTIIDDIKKDGVKESNGCDLTSVDPKNIEIEKGTKLILTKLQKDISKTELFLRKRLARKFIILGKKYKFRVYINGKEIALSDRDYFSKIQYLWFFGDHGKKCVKECKKLDNKKEISSEIVLADGTKCAVGGWIGTVHERSNLEEGNNTIIIHSRGKSIHDNLLTNIDNSGFVTKYLIGEIKADFLDDDNKEDITTSDRQKIQENNERFEKIKEFVEEIIKKIRVQWQSWRAEDATIKACQIPAIKKWFGSLKGDNKKYAKQLFGKIDRFPTEDITYKKEIYKNSIIAFQTLAIRDNLSKLDNINSSEHIETFINILGEMDQLESAHYYEIIRSRIGILKKFENLVDGKVKEKVLQKYIFNHLWLLNQTWERANVISKRMEETIIKGIRNIKFTEKEKLARADIQYKTVAGKHVIIELKKYDAYVNLHDLQKQVNKYKNILLKILKDVYHIKNPEIEIICLLGKKPGPLEMTEKEIKEHLKLEDARYITYDELLEEVTMVYGSYIEKNKELIEIQNLIGDLV